MHKGKFVFSQLLDFLNRNDFNYLARKYDGDKYVKQFTFWNQLCVLMFGQLSNRESLRDLVLATQAHTSQKPTQTETITSSKSLRIEWSQKHGNAEQEHTLP